MSESIDRGNQFFRRVMEWDTHRKRLLSKTELENSLNELLAEFVRSLSSALRVSISFGNVHAKMRKQWHTELTYVEMDGPRCRLHFDESLIGSTSPHTGLIFVAKSWVLLPVVATALSLEPALAGSFVFEIGDNATLGEVAFNSPHPDACLIWDYDFAASDGHRDYRELCATEWISWEQREPKIFWRGSSTGHRLYPPPAEGEADSLRWLPRLALCKACTDPEIANFCDAGISQLRQMPEPHLQARVRDAGLIRGPVPREDFLKFRGAFDIDGNANAWSGLFCSLLGGSCVLKISSAGRYRQWYYDRLIPWQNFVPIQSDLADLRDAVSWFANHDANAAGIAAAGRELANEMTTRSALSESGKNLIRWNQRR